MFHVKTSITVKLTSDKFAPVLAGGLLNDNGEIFTIHQVNDICKVALERGGNGVVLFISADDGEHGLFVALAVHIGVQRPNVNGDMSSVLKVFDVKALCPGEFVHGLFAVGNVLNVGVDDVHIYFPFWPVIFSTGRPFPVDKPC